jgi:hypothetical protein
MAAHFLNRFVFRFVGAGLPSYLHSWNETKARSFAESMCFALVPVQFAERFPAG